MSVHRGTCAAPVMNRKLPDEFHAPDSVGATIGHLISTEKRCHLLIFISQERGKASHTSLPGMDEYTMSKSRYRPVSDSRRRLAKTVSVSSTETLSVRRRRCPTKALMRTVSKEYHVAGPKPRFESATTFLEWFDDPKDEFEKSFSSGRVKEKAILQRQSPSAGDSNGQAASQKPPQRILSDNESGYCHVAGY